MTIAEIGSVRVDQNDATVIYYESGSAIDADGANGQHGGPFAYRFDNTGLDTLSSAGYPHAGWRNVFELDDLGHPRTDGKGNIFSATTLMPAVDAWAIPYAVVNPIVRKRARGIVIGCHAVIEYSGRVVSAVVADVGEEDKIGEMSIAAARLLGIPCSPRTGGVVAGVKWYFHPGIPAVVNGVTYPLIAAP